MCLQWRFPDNGNGMEYGLETGDIDIFKKDPIGSLAREICQNSIDANRGIHPTRIEFSTFDVARNDIPGIDELSEQIEACYQYRKDDKKEGAAIQAIHSMINLPIIPCLRISDFNTTGLIGVSTFERGVPFYNLTKTSGTSFKGAGSGGSKGIGKAAAFVASGTRTVFYSTYTQREEKGYIGISKLRSVPIDADGYKMSVAEGYYGCKEDSFPCVDSELCLDPNFTRAYGDYGTDLYLIGFGHRANWKSDLMFKLLDSFMVAFVKGLLEVTVDNITLSKDTIKKIIYDTTSFPGKDASSLKSIMAQYELLTSVDNVTHIEKIVKGYGPINVLVKSYSQGESHRATGTCDIIRYPYMKITSHGVGRLIPYSAMCIIENGDLNEALRRMENAEHTAWSWERLEGEEAQSNAKSTLSRLKNLISRAINEALKTEVGDKTDIAGAGAYLPSVDDSEPLDGEELGGDSKEFTHIGKIRQNQADHKRVELENDKDDKMDRSVTTPVSGDDIGNDAEVSNPEGDPGSTGVHVGGGTSVDAGHPTNTNNTGIDESSPKKGYTRKLLGGIRSRNMYDKSRKKFLLTFVSNCNEANCDIVIKEIGESSDTYEVDIISAEVNGESCTIKDGVIKGISLETGKKYTVSYTVSKGSRFATGVEFYANR